MKTGHGIMSHFDQRIADKQPRDDMRRFIGVSPELALVGAKGRLPGEREIKGEDQDDEAGDPGDG